MAPAPFAIVCALAVVLAGCTTGAPRPPAQPPPSRVSTTPAPSQAPATPAAPAGPDVAAMMSTVRGLAGIGAREATSRQFRQAARALGDQLAALGFVVTRQPLRVPAGVSWGVRVGAGRSANLVARLPGPSPDGRHVVVGAHLDTVPQSPGAEDNASGLAVLLELARLARRVGTRLPVTFVVFGAEEPRGPGDDQHHYGSRAYVRRVSRGAEPAPTSMVSLDRVGTPGPVPVCTGGLSPRRVQRQLLAAAERLGVPARACENRTSDHWPFEKAGYAVARVGGNDYDAYHSARDVPRVVSRRQLDRVSRVLWAWLRAG